MYESERLQRLARAVDDAALYLEADAQAWESGAEHSAHAAYLAECARLRRAVANELQAAASGLIASADPHP